MGRIKRSPPLVLEKQEDRISKRARVNTGSISDDPTVSVSPIQLINLNSPITSGGALNIVIESCEKIFFKDTLIDISIKHDLLLTKFNELSTEFIKLRDLNVSLVELIKNFSVDKSLNSSMVKHVNSYANIVQNNPVVVVEPKNDDQKTVLTIKDISNKLDPNCFNIKNVRGAAKGGIVIECQSKQYTVNLKNTAVDKLGEHYNVNLPTSRFPMIRVVGFLNNYEDNELLEMIKKHNITLLHENSALKIVSAVSF